MRRREFITLFGSVAAWPLEARAQQPYAPLVGFLSSASPDLGAHLLTAFRGGLEATGFLDGRNVKIEFRWADGRYELLPDLAADLVARQPAVIVATGGVVSALAAKAATRSIPIVFVTGFDPVKSDLVSSISRPTGNVTGITLFQGELLTKRLQLLREFLPEAALAVLLNPSSSELEAQIRDVEATAQLLGQQIQVLTAKDDIGIEAAFDTISREQVRAVVVSGDPFFTNRRDKLVGLAAQCAVPALYAWREFVEAGGLMSYGSNLTDGYRRAGAYTGQLLRGASVADLPVEQSTRFELAINLATAKALGLTIPPMLLARVDEVIE